jgi:hypothetical protein
LQYSFYSVLIRALLFIAGWSSPVARQAHNLKVVSSNLAPATNIFNDLQRIADFHVFAGAALVPQSCFLFMKLNEYTE